MSSIKLYKLNNDLNGEILIGGSKSESNRLLIIKSLLPNNIFIKNLSNSFDTKVLKESLNKEGLLNVHHSGTAMRFLTAYCASQENKFFILKGSDRMHKRPIYDLVESMIKIGAKIEYIKNKGYPPLKIYGKKIIGGNISIKANISSQYISSLMLSAINFKNGLCINLSDKITSYPYIYMTLNLLIKSGISASWIGRKISIKPNIKNNLKKYFFIESDWSSASYYYSLSALSKKSNICLKIYKKKSLQGDQLLKDIYLNYFGVKTLFIKDSIILNKNPLHKLPEYIEIDLNKSPDIAQTIAVTCAGLKIKCLLKGLETLKVKETDRLFALKNELDKIGVKTYITNNSIEIINFEKKNNKIPIIDTYDDHRMAMSFAPLALFNPLIINNPEVVEKSYPNFWDHFKYLGFIIE